MPTDSKAFDPQIPRDLVKRGEEDAALDYILEFVSAGVRAMIAMADYWYDKGDYEASLSWMDRADRCIADDDHVSPIYLSSAYKRGLGRGTAEERHHRAFKILERVAESGNLVVIHEMMANYRYGLNGAPKDRERFEYWAKKAAALGSDAAARMLGKEAVKAPPRQ